MRLEDAPERISGYNPVRSAEAAQSLENKDEGSLVQSGAMEGMVAARGLEPRASCQFRIQRRVIQALLPVMEIP